MKKKKKKDQGMIGWHQWKVLILIFQESRVFLQKVELWEFRNYIQINVNTITFLTIHVLYNPILAKHFSAKHGIIIFFVGAIKNNLR